MKFTSSCHEVYCYCHVMKFTSSCHEVYYYYCHVMNFTSSCHEVYYYCPVMKFTIVVVKFTIVVMELVTAVMKLTKAAMKLTIVVMKLTMAIMKLTITVMTLTIAVMKFTIAEHNPYMRLFTTTNILLLPTLWQDNPKTPITTTLLTWCQESVGTPPTPRPGQLGMQATLCCQLHHRVQ